MYNDSGGVNLTENTQENNNNPEFINDTIDSGGVNLTENTQENNNPEFEGIKIGGGVKIGGMTVTLENVGSTGAIIISVGGVQETIEENDIKTINCIPISNEKTIYTDLKNNRKAAINIGDTRDPNCQKESLQVEDPLLSVGSIISIGGRKLALENVGSSKSIVVDVEGVQKTILPNQIENINCIPILNVASIYADSKDDRKATVNIGDDRSQCY